jgi:hypothetical protein
MHLKCHLHIFLVGEDIPEDEESAVKSQFGTGVVMCDFATYWLL